MWKQADLETMARLFPNDYRPPLYLGLYLLHFARYSLDSDYQPVMKAFERAAELNPSSALPFYFIAQPYVVGGIGGLLSMANAKCLDDVVPRTEDCLALDDIQRKGMRFLTQAIAADPSFAPVYELRATALLHLKQSRQAIRDYNKVLELNPNANVYNDRALAKMGLHEYQAAILDFTKAIAQGCNTSACQRYENRANAFLSIHDYSHAISDLSQAIRNELADKISAFNIDQFRRIYPEYDNIADDVLCEKLRVLFVPEMTYAVFSKKFLIDAQEFTFFILPDLFLKRGDAYADMGEMTRANREYDRVSAGFPKRAETAFMMRNGTRVRVRQ
jgi:tetratricopeptide (TPR) repeat protein